MLIWPRPVFEELKAWAEKCYPYEGCGLLLGQFGPDGQKRIQRFTAISNILHDRDKASSSAVLETAASTLGRRVESQGQFEFVMDPGQFNRVALSAEKEGMDVIGILHTHPDHPAKPSATDASQPLLAVWSNVIVKVDQGRFIELRSWVREEEASPFSEEPVKIDPA